MSKLMTLFPAAALLSASYLTQAADIVVNQVGFQPEWPKTAFLVNENEAIQYAEVLDATDKHPVFKIKVGSKKRDPQTKDTLQMLHFSSFKTPGRYVIKAGNTESVPFEIGEAIFKQPLKLMLRSYYLQRCGIAIDDTATGLKHQACHLHDGVIARDDPTHKSGDVVATVGGWHDAGDYGKYIATTAVAAGRLLSLYEYAPDLLRTFSLDIPESKNNQPDILDEAQVGLDWMLTMQRSDGALYRKIGGDAWPKELTPDHDLQTRHIYPLTTPETAKAAAVWAMAARTYQATRPEKATQYLQAAQKSWAYLTTIDQQIFDYQKDDDKGSGPYMYNETDNDDSLKHDRDDRFWAAAELLITTGDKQYEAYIAKQLPNMPLSPYEWKNPSALAMTHILFHPKLQHHTQWQATVKKQFITRADQLLGNIERSGYQIANTRFVWSSNKITAEEGVILLAAYRLTHKPAYLHGAIAQLNYILGRNHFNMSFVSEIGAKSVQNVSHIYLSAVNKKLPGLLVGGPNALEQSNIGPKNMGPLSYIDDVRSYATNEYAIDYNASMIGLLGQLITMPSLTKP